MPAPTSTFIRTSTKTAVSVALEPAHSVLLSMMLLNKANDLSGYSQWLVETAASLTPEQAHNNLLVLEGLHYAVRPQQSWSSFPAYLDNLALQDPMLLRDEILNTYLSMPQTEESESLNITQPTDILATLGTYLDFLQSHFAEDCIHLQIETEVYALLKDPAAMQQRIVTHLREMWVNYFASEWERTRPLLQESVKAFKQLDLQNVSPAEAAKKIINQEVPEGWQRKLTSSRLKRVIFVPTAHLGPYLGTFASKQAVHLFIGARLPQGVTTSSSDLNRSELLVRLSAMSDDNRLQILQIIGEAGELCSKDIMEQLALSQSATSRHLKQLTATGYLDEKWRDGAKCYSLSNERIKSTLNAVEQFLLG